VSKGRFKKGKKMRKSGSKQTGSSGFTWAFRDFNPVHPANPVHRVFLRQIQVSLAIFRDGATSA
jgi:hypothetical protein